MSNLINRSNSLSRISICAFYLVTVSFLLLANLDTLKGVTYEGSDFAANSVLIQSAKNFSLWTGNYSRVGFYHPGPAILYVLTAGEVIFHDWFHLVEHPFAGQIIAVSFYNALWITLAFIGFHRLSQSKSIALGALSVLLLTLALMEHSLFNGIWMPYMYVFPFVIAVMAIGRVIDGKTDSLQSLAISSGFLINGHASFIGILGVLLIVSLAGNYLIYRRQPQSERILLSPLFITRHKKSLSLACLMLSLFFIPLVVKTITAFPGPVKEYASFSGGHETNSLANSVTFMASYWGGRLWAVLGLALLALAFLVSPRAPQELRTRVQSLAASLCDPVLRTLWNRLSKRKIPRSVLLRCARADHCLRCHYPAVSNSYQHTQDAYRSLHAGSTGDNFPRYQKARWLQRVL